MNVNKITRWVFIVYAIPAICASSILFLDWGLIGFALGLTQFLLAGFLCMVWRINKALSNEIKATTEQLKEAEEHIHYLTQHDSHQQLIQAERNARVSAMNCYHYLHRIEKLNAMLSVMQTINKNLIEEHYKGKCYGNKNSNRRANKEGDSRNNTSESEI